MEQRQLKQQQEQLIQEKEQVRHSFRQKLLQQQDALQQFVVNHSFLDVNEIQRQRLFDANDKYTFI